MPTNVELSTHPEGQYRQIERADSNGYISKETLGEYFDLFPTEVGGGSTSYWCDYFYQNRASGQLVLWGGSAGDGASCGLAFAISGNAFSNASANFGARLAYYGELEFRCREDLGPPSGLFHRLLDICRGFLVCIHPDHC